MSPSCENGVLLLEPQLKHFSGLQAMHLPGPKANITVSPFGVHANCLPWIASKIAAVTSPGVDAKYIRVMSPFRLEATYILSIHPSTVRSVSGSRVSLSMQCSISMKARDIQTSRMFLPHHKQLRL